MKKALYRLEAYSENSATESEKTLLNFLLNQPRKAVEMDIHTLAKVGYCSAATIVRVCKKNGFTGFKELKRALLNDLHFSDELIETKFDSLNQEDLKKSITNTFEKSIRAIENTYSLLDVQDLERIVGHILKSPTLYVFGIGASLLVAKDLQQKFERVNKRTVLFDDLHMQLLSSNNISPQEVAIIISYSGLTREMLDISKNIKKRGGLLVSITKYGSNKLSALCDYNLYVAQTEGLLRAGAGTSRITQLMIVDALFQVYLRNEKKDSVDRIVSSQNLLDKEK